MSHRDDDRSIGNLIRLGGEREMPSPEGMERARAAAEESWRRGREQASRSRGFRWYIPLALAAAAGVAAFAWWLGLARESTPAVTVAHIATLQGAAAIGHADYTAPAREGSIVLSGGTLTTANGRVAIALIDGVSLRLDRESRVRFNASNRVTLVAGTVYVDSGGINTGSALVIGTPAGDVAHVGTQFLVSVAGDATRVRVREGRVLLANSDIAAGEELEVRDGRQTWRRGLPSFGAPWEEFANVAPTLDIEGRPLAEFLAWLAREHGWLLRYSSDALQQQTHEIRLHGSIAGLETPAMLERMTLVTGLVFEPRDGVLFVGEHRGPMR
jgi:ferric-dicitrate binding protein FerR (iron transport regulator)